MSSSLLFVWRGRKQADGGAEGESALGQNKVFVIGVMGT